LSTRTVWNVLDLSGCQIALILWERSASRRRLVSTVKGSWAGRESDGGSDVEGGSGSGDGGTSRPATNITGASCTTSSGGYEFMLRGVVVELRRRDACPQNTFSSNLTFFACHTHITHPILTLISLVGIPGTDVTRDASRG